MRRELETMVAKEVLSTNKEVQLMIYPSGGLLESSNAVEE
jgi:hypothetical protein